jgi:single-strand DNA-binding protein
MSGSVNKVILLGNLGRDPEIRSMQSGKKMASFSIATSKRWKDKNTQEQKENTSWHNIVVFNEGLVDVIEKYVKKGTKIYVEGELSTRKYQDKDGNERYTTEVILQGYNSNLTMLGSNNSLSASQEQPITDTSNDISNNDDISSESNDSSNLDEDIPF